MTPQASTRGVGIGLKHKRSQPLTGPSGEKISQQKRARTNCLTKLAENPAKLVAAAFVKLRELTERGGKG